MAPVMASMLLSRLFCIKSLCESERQTFRCWAVDGTLTHCSRYSCYSHSIESHHLRLEERPVHEIRTSELLVSRFYYSCKCDWKENYFGNRNERENDLSSRSRFCWWSKVPSC